MGARRLGAAAERGRALDAGLLGLERRHLPVNAGYWGPTVGFYGGVNYGFGYGGNGYPGGRWDNGRFAYNSAVNNFGGTHVASVYRPRSPTTTTAAGVSFNGGTGAW